MPIVESVSAALGALKSGVELSKSLGDKAVGLTLRVQQFAIGMNDSETGATLAFLSVTNESDTARSVTDIIFDFGTSRAFRVPLLELKAPTGDGSVLDAYSYVHEGLFQDVSPPFTDLRRLPQDLYLLPNESQSGCALFIFEQKSKLSPPLVLVEVGGFGILSKQLTSVL